MAFHPERIPADLVRHVVAHLGSRSDLYRCALVNRLFHLAAIPLLWSTLDVRMKPWARPGPLHPTAVLLQRPQYCRYVFEICEDTSWTHMSRAILQERLSALRLCVNLRSFSWTDSSTFSENDAAFLTHLDVLQHLHITELSVRISAGISPVVWQRLMQMRGLRSFALSSSQCVLDGISAWAAAAGSTMTHLELSVASEADRYPTFITQLPRLQSLRLDAPCNIIPDLLACLPSLVALDVRYRLSDKIPAPRPRRPPAARLRDLTVHVVHGRTAAVWDWLPQLAPHRASLRALTVHARARPAPGASFPVPGAFLAWLAETHGAALQRLLLFALHLAPDALAAAFRAFPALEALALAPDGDDEGFLRRVGRHVHATRRLRVLRIHSGAPMADAGERARAWMARAHGSQLVAVHIGTEAFEGKWVRAGAAKLVFEVARQRDLPDRWM